MTQADIKRLMDELNFPAFNACCSDLTDDEVIRAIRSLKEVTK